MTIIFVALAAAPVRASGTASLGPGDGPPRLGVYLDHPYGDHEFGRSVEIQKLGRHLGLDLRLLLVFVAWGNPWREFPAGKVRWAAERGITTIVTWEPWDVTKSASDQPAFRLATIVEGRHDGYIRRFARQVRDAGVPVFLRFAHEMNGNWYPWAGTVNGNRPADYVAAWRHARRLFREERATNVAWMWSPCAATVPDAADNQPERFFPGLDEVDWLALSGYNFGTSQPGSRWQTFDEIFARPYQRLTRLAPHPVMIAEVATTGAGGSKGAWIREMFDSLPRYPRVRGIVWFNVDKEQDWRIESDAFASHVFRAGAEAWQRPLAATDDDTNTR